MAAKPISSDYLNRYIQTVFRPEASERANMLEQAAALAGFRLPIQGQARKPQVNPTRDRIVTSMLEAAAAAAASDAPSEVYGGTMQDHGLSFGEQRAAATSAMAEIRSGLFRDAHKVVRAFEEGPGSEMAGATIWGAYNAVTRYLGHERGKSDESRAAATWFGTGEASTPAITARAHKVALRLAQA